MAATVRCPNPDCQKATSVAAENLGKQARCKKCGTQFELAGNGEPSAAGETFAGSKSTQPAPAVPAGDDNVNTTAGGTPLQPLRSGPV